MLCLGHIWATHIHPASQDAVRTVRMLSIKENLSVRTVRRVSVRTAYGHSRQICPYGVRFMSFSHGHCYFLSSKVTSVLTGHFCPDCRTSHGLSNSVHGCAWTALNTCPLTTSIMYVHFPVDIMFCPCECPFSGILWTRSFLKSVHIFTLNGHCYGQLRMSMEKCP